MSYEKVNGYIVTPYDVNGVICYAIRDGKIGCLIYNNKRTPIIVATKEYAIEVALSIPRCAELNNFTILE